MLVVVGVRIGEPPAAYAFEVAGCGCAGEGVDAEACGWVGKSGGAEGAVGGGGRGEGGGAAAAGFTPGLGMGFLERGNGVERGSGGRVRVCVGVGV